LSISDIAPGSFSLGSEWRDEYDPCYEKAMSDDELKAAEIGRNKRLRSLELVAVGVSTVAMLGLLVIWSFGGYSSHGAGHRWAPLLWLAYGFAMVWRGILMQRRTDLKATPSPLSTLGLSRRTAGPVKPVRSDHWSERSSEAR
jgi:hypothetical protein